VTTEVAEFEIDPWANRHAPGVIPSLPVSPLDVDPARNVFLGGRDRSATTGSPSLYFAGTDVTGPLHLGHLYCFGAGQSLAESADGRFVISLNEIESGLSRDLPGPLAFANSRHIQQSLQNHGLHMHSRLRDTELVYAALRLFRWLLKEQGSLTTSIYSHIDGSDLLGICPMILAPVFLNDADPGVVCAIYGYDEVQHVEFMYRLYQDMAFIRWVERDCGRGVPRFTYVLTPLVASSDQHFKMSKSRHRDAVAWGAAHDPSAAHRSMFTNLCDFVIDRAPKSFASPLGRALATHAGIADAVL
jgi:hypothetical protein